jgi:hypothetical protein
MRPCVPPVYKRLDLSVDGEIVGLVINVQGKVSFRTATGLISGRRKRVDRLEASGMKLYAYNVWRILGYCNVSVKNGDLRLVAGLERLFARVRDSRASGN